MDSMAMNSALQPILLTGETVRWVGVPGQGLRLRKSDGLFVPFSLFWGGFAIFWNLEVWREGAPLFFKLFGLPFLIIGLWLMAGRLFHDAWIRQRQVYAVTDERVIVMSGNSVETYSLDMLSSVRLDGDTVELQPSGLFGTFGNTGSVRSGFGIWMPAMAMNRLEFLPDAAAVFRLINEGTRSKART